MGCFNETCMGSNLPILAGEECVLVMMVENPYVPTGVYATTGYAPMLAIYGTYNDYGGLEKIQDEETALKLLASIPNLCVKTDEGLQPYTVTTLEDFLEASCRYGLYATKVRGVLKGVAKDTLAIHTVFLKPGFVNLVDQVAEYTSTMREIGLHIEKAKQAVLTHNMVETEHKLRPEESRSKGPNMERLDLHIKAMDAVRYVEDMITKSSPNPAADMFITSCWMTEPEYTTKMVMDLIKANVALGHLRKSWHIPSGAGSQNSISDIQKAFAKFYQDEIERIDRWFEDEEDYDPEENGD